RLHNPVAVFRVARYLVIHMQPVAGKGPQKCRKAFLHGEAARRARHKDVPSDSLDKQHNLKEEIKNGNEFSFVTVYVLPPIDLFRYCNTSGSFSNGSCISGIN